MNSTARKAQALIKDAAVFAEYSESARKAGRAYMTQRADETAAEAIAALHAAQQLISDMITELEAK